MSFSKAERQGSQLGLAWLEFPHFTVNSLSSIEFVNTHTCTYTHMGVRGEKKQCFMVSKLFCWGNDRMTLSRRGPNTSRLSVTQPVNTVVGWPSSFSLAVIYIYLVIMDY